MLEEFREQASASPFFEEDEVYEEVKKDRRKGYFLGMSPAQRFVVAVLLLMMVCIMGTLLLLVTERVVPPFLF